MIRVYLIDAGTEELMKLDFIFEAGQIEEETPLLSSTVNSMLAEGTTGFTAEELNENLDFYGAISTILPKRMQPASQYFS